MAASTNKMTLTLAQLDADNVNVLNRVIGPISYAGAVGDFKKGTLADTNATSQSLPTTIILQYYFKNTHVSAVITVTWTYQGGASQVIRKVQPGGFIAFSDPVTAATAGVTAISLQSDTSGATFEQFCGG